MFAPAKAVPGGPLALIVDDYVDAREMYSEYLTASGFVVHQAGDGRQGLDMMTQHPYDVIVLDLALPRLDGWEFMRIHHRLRSGVPIVVLSAHALQPDRSLADNYGHPFVPKPCAPEVLLNTLRDVIRTPPELPRVAIQEEADPPSGSPAPFDRLTRALAEVVGGACHDMANSLAVLLAHADAPDRERSAAVTGRVLRQTLTQVQELHRFVRLFYRNRAEPYEPVACGDFRKYLLQLLPPRHGGKRGTVIVKCESPDVSLPPILLRLIIAPLVANSLEAAQAAGLADELKIRVRVHVLPDGEGIFFQITDNGPGFGAALPELTRALSEGRSFSTKGESRGYGLTHLARLIERLQGRIVLADQPAGGSSVQIHLPLEEG